MSGQPVTAYLGYPGGTREETDKEWAVNEESLGLTDARWHRES